MSPFIRVLLLVTLSMVIVVAHPVEERSGSKEDTKDTSASSGEYDDDITRLEKTLKQLVALDDYIGVFIAKMKKSEEEEAVPDDKKDYADRYFDEQLTKLDGLYIIFDIVMANIEDKIEALKDNADQNTDNGKTGKNGVKSLIQPLRDYWQFAMM